VRGAFTYHVSECINEIELLRNIESLGLALPIPETNLLQGSYGGDGSRGVATECMGNNTEEHTSDVCPRGHSGDPRVVTSGRSFTRTLEVVGTTSTDFVPLANDLGEFFQGGEPSQDC